MTGLNVGHVGIAGEVRCIVKREDGSVKEDTGFQKNLILNQGLDFFGGDKGVNIFASCVIGSGNTAPTINQTQLVSFVALVNGIQHSAEYAYSATGDNLYKSNKVYKYSFAGLNNVNISEVGLASQGSSSANYYLCTRALIRDIAGQPTAITILTGEVLEVYYKVWRVISVLDTSYVVNMLDGKGGSKPYNVVVRPFDVGKVGWDTTGDIAAINTINRISSGELSVITSEPALTEDARPTIIADAYVPSSYKRRTSMTFSVSQANHNIRVIFSLNKFYRFQFRFGSVLDDSPIPKTSNETLTIPLEFSWGRYEGAL